MDSLVKLGVVYRGCRIGLFLKSCDSVVKSLCRCINYRLIGAVTCFLGCRELRFKLCPALRGVIILIELFCFFDSFIKLSIVYRRFGIGLFLKRCDGVVQSFCRRINYRLIGAVARFLSCRKSIGQYCPCLGCEATLIKSLCSRYSILKLGKINDGYRFKFCNSVVKSLGRRIYVSLNSVFVSLAGFLESRFESHPGICGIELSIERICSFNSRCELGVVHLHKRVKCFAECLSRTVHIVLISAYEDLLCCSERLLKRFPGCKGVIAGIKSLCLVYVLFKLIIIHGDERADRCAKCFGCSINYCLIS